MPYAVIESGDGSSSTWLGTARSLGLRGINVVRLSPISWYHSRYCTTILCPDEREDPAQYLSFLLRVGKRLRQQRGCKNVLFPSSDRGLVLISQNIDRIREYFEPVCPEWAVVANIVDKRKTYAHAKKHGIPFPTTVTHTSMDHVAEIAGDLPYPCLLKPLRSHLFWPRYRMKLVQVTNKDELLKTYHSFPGLQFLIQEEIPGPQDLIYNLRACLNKDSQPLAVFTGRKLRQCPPRFGVGSFVESVWQPTVVDLGLKLLECLQFYGIASVEFKQDPRTKEFKLIEVNGRPGTQIYLATICGVNTPYISYQEALGKMQEPLERYTCRYDLGVRWTHLSLDLVSLLQQRARGQLTLQQWLRSTLQGRGKRVYALWSWDDPYPFLSELKKVIPTPTSFLNLRNQELSVFRQKRG